jgi:Rha family phage regulatory protein
MNHLKVVSHNGKLVTDSREVAGMVGKEHKILLRDIRKYVEYMGTKMNPSNFFIESFYQDAYGRNKVHFLLTKKGCDMVANKMTGKKGVLFTAEYVTRFEEMEKELNQPFKLPKTYKEALLQLVEKEEQNEQLQAENESMKPKAAYHDLVLQSKSLLSVTKIAKDFGMGAPTLNRILHELGVQYKQSGTWVLYHKYQNKGYAQTKTHNIDAEKSNVHLYWTQKGRLFIYDLLKEKKGIVPLIEKENEQLRLVD